MFVLFWMLLGLLTGPPAPSTGPSRAALTFYDSDVIPPGVVRTAFSASLDNVVYMQATWTRAPGAHTAGYHVFSPDGALYQDIAIAFTGAPDGTALTWAQLPIAGTFMGRLPGTWTVTLTLDGSTKVLTTQQFELTP